MFFMLIQNMIRSDRLPWLRRCPPRTRTGTSRMNVSPPHFDPIILTEDRALVLMDGTPALNLASFVTTYM